MRSMLCIISLLLFFALAAQAAVYTVDYPSDGGAGTLRQAILDANANSGPDVIYFNSLTDTVQVLTDLPPMTDVVCIEGNGQTVAANSTAVELLTLDTALPGSSGSTLTGLAIIRGNSGIRLLSNGNIVRNCRIGTDWQDTAGEGNTYGIRITGNNNYIGGDRLNQQGNVIAGNSAVGLYLDTGSENIICGNLIGVNAGQTAALPNENGVWLLANGNTMGIPGAGMENIVAGNRYDGIALMGSANVVQNNFIGYCPDTKNYFSNSPGLYISADWNLIGGDINTLERNVIAGNTRNAIGIQVSGSGNTICGNFIGADETGSAPVANCLGVYLGGNHNLLGGSNAAGLQRGNIISGNSQAGVDVGGAGNTVVGNYIGLDRAGTGALPNQTGIVFSGAAGTDCYLGGSDPHLRNVISGNTNYGICKTGDAAAIIRGNLIGTDAAGSARVSNGYVAVYLYQTQNCLLGGPVLQDRNVICDNSIGIDVYQAAPQSNTVIGNWIGVLGNGAVQSPAGVFGVNLFSGATGNFIGAKTEGGNLISGWQTGINVDGLGSSRNGFYGNTITACLIMGIDLGGDGPGASSGANEDKQPPGNIYADVNGVSGSAAAFDYIEVFQAEKGAGQYGGSLRLLNSITADAAGHWGPVSITGVNAGDYICAAASSPQNNTSEFSQNVLVASAVLYTPTISPTASHTPTRTHSSTMTDTPTISPTLTASLTATESLTITETSTITMTSTISPTNTVSPTMTPTGTITLTATATPTMTITPTSTPTSVSAEDMLGSKTALAYPNPGKDTMTFLVACGQPSEITILIYNSAAECIAQLHAANTSTLVWDCSQAAPGIYFARISVNHKQRAIMKLGVVK
ncbi:hypothetical protein JW933_03540 [candidate division FCPU426 bacterium]|nr:hypothetical protein [candidate division FCPU426 bacterium]